MSITWTNEKRKLSDLHPWSRNPRQITEKQAKRLEESFATFGQVETIAVGPNNEVYNGHQRLNVLMAKHGGDYEVECRVASRELTEKEREKLTVFLHKGAAGEWDFDILANEFELDELLEWGFDKKELDLDLWAGEMADDPGAQIDKAEELREKWGVETGQLWQLGEHRLICGDCTDKAVVERVMGGERAQLLMADPPYNVKYTGGSTNDSSRPDSYQDDLNDDDWADWLTNGLKNGYDFSDEKSALLIWFASSKMRNTLDGFENAGWRSRALIIWNKTKAHYGALGAQYKNKYEPMWYCFKNGQSPRFFGATNETTVWEFEQPHINDLHPTMKPIELYDKCINNHSERGDIVLELFSGSGTTIIACERLGRKCRAVEISPAYCAVAIQRWVDMTGGEPVLLGIQT